MNFRQHLATGTIVGIASVMPLELNMSDSFSFVSSCMFGAVLPDVDLILPLAGKNSNWLRKTFSHRGFMHTPLFAIILSIFICLISGHVYTAAGFLIGTLCHIILDSFTAHGIMLLWPYPKYMHFTTVTCGSTSCSVITILLTATYITLIALFVPVRDAPIYLVSVMEDIHNLIGGAHVLFG